MLRARDNLTLRLNGFEPASELVAAGRISGKRRFYQSDQDRVGLLQFILLNQYRPTSV
jgi:hypothetical protein